MPKPVNDYLTTRATLRRIARRLEIPGVTNETENHALAAAIEERVCVLSGQLLRATAAPARPMHCQICGDEDGPLLLRDCSLICETCDEMFESATLSKDTKGVVQS